MNKKDWNPDLYLKFDKERIQPSIDLVTKIDFENPFSIIDIGCGPGNSTQVLFQRWPDSKILGIDNSEAMIKKAKLDYPNLEWMLVDAEKETIAGKFDIVFSNAAIQWIPNHFELFKRLKNNLTEKGSIAIQLPLFFDMPLGKSIRQISKNKKWAHLIESVNDMFTIHTPAEYYDMLSELFGSVKIWVTDYVHIMKSHVSVFEMIQATGLRPYLEQLENDSQKYEFEEMVLESIKKDYPGQKNGKVLFPFKRLFIIVKK